MIRICAVCREPKPCVPTMHGAQGCLEHYDELVAIEAQMHAAKVTKNEMRFLDKTLDRRSKQRENS